VEDAPGKAFRRFPFTGKSESVFAGTMLREHAQGIQHGLMTPSKDCFSSLPGISRPD